MNIVSKIAKQAVAGLAIVCVVMGVAAVANAIPPNQVFRTITTRTITGQCCFSWGETVTVTEPAQITPVVVTLSTDYVSNGDFNVGIAVNGHPCQFSGPSDLESWPASNGFRGRTVQWVILPSDGLVKGNNTLTLCGGSPASDNSAISLGFHTMAVTISK